MDGALRGLQLSVAACFLLLGLAAVRQWIGERGRSRGFLALALGSLGLVAVVAEVETLSGYARQWLNDAVLAAFLISGWGLVMFRDSFIPLGRRGRLAAAAGVAATLALGVAARLPSDPAAVRSAPQEAAVALIAAVWLACIAEPTMRLWLEARGRPPVQRARLRSLSAGYAGIAVVLLLAATPRSLTRSAAAQMALDAITLVVAPILYAGFSPPRWLRIVWRQPEEEAFSDALEELLLDLPDRDRLAERALYWAMRLVGAEAGAVVDSDGAVLAPLDLDRETALLLAGSLQGETTSVTRLPGRRTALTVRLPLAGGFGAIVVLSGPFTPLFGAEEAVRLARYAVAVATALDRVRLVAQQRLAEQELRQARDAAEVANRAKSDFLSRMSHELRTPLSAILGFSDLLQMSNPRPDQIEFMETITKAGVHLRDLINDVLDISRIEAGRLSVSNESLDAREVLEESLRLVDPQAAERRVSLRSDVARGEVTVMADRQRLKQVLLNLLTNAIKYNRIGGEVIASLVTGDAAGRVRLEVRDTGEGIAPEDMPRLFQPFERMHRGSVEGTGLGLALSRSLVEAMGGRIGAESIRGIGSCFWVDLAPGVPVAETEARMETEVAGLPVRSGGGRLTVLYIEDNLANFQLVDELCKRRRPDVRLLPAMQGSIGLDLARAHRPDLILLDLHLPVMDGEEVLRRLRQDESTAHIPVVVVSADATRPQMERLRQAGADDYITKPIDVRRFLEVLDTMLGRGDAAASEA